MNSAASSAPIVVGETNGADFPTTPGAFQPSFNEPSATINRGWDAFVTRFNATGSQMVFSTYLGAPPVFDPSFPGSVKGGEERARAVVVDAFDNVIVVVANLDPFQTRGGRVRLALQALGLREGSTYQMHELITGARYLWNGPENGVLLDPAISPVQIFRVRHQVRTEHDFDYFF